VLTASFRFFLFTGLWFIYLTGMLILQPKFTPFQYSRGIAGTIVTVFLLANYYLSDNPALAVKWFEQGYPHARQEFLYLNNYAYALSKIHIYEKAEAIILEALLLSPTDKNLLDTHQQIRNAVNNKDQLDD
jgi:hypothetical protein